MKRILFLYILIAIFSIELFPQSELTGILSYDSRIAFHETSNPEPVVLLPQQKKKSPALAGLLSLVVPGAGEIYNEDYIKAAIFIAVEAAVITTAIIYDNKGDNQTDVFQNYADKEWSVVRYAEWLNQYKDGNISINPDENLPPWERVNWEQLNEAESRFSHKLPSHGDQQYYEMIGKYYQFSSGWSDYTFGPDNVNLSPKFIDYSHMRGKANDYYNVASKAIIGLYINHFLSTLDAVWSSVQYNRQFSVSVRALNIQYAGTSELIPVLRLNYSF
jgi:hypothetical protein